MKTKLILSATLLLTMPVSAQEIVKGKYLTYEIYPRAVEIFSNSNKMPLDDHGRLGSVMLGQKLDSSKRLDYFKETFCPAMIASIPKELRSHLRETRLRMSMYFNNQGEIKQITFRMDPEYKNTFSEETLYLLYQNIMKIKLDLSSAEVVKNPNCMDGYYYDYAYYHVMLFQLVCD